MFELTNNKKKVLITAKNSYIGNSFASWVKNLQKYSLDLISCRTDEWKQTSFSGYDVIFHVAGIAHVDAKSGLESLYYKVNRDLTIELAEKAKADGVKQFIFMSSIIVYGDSGEKIIGKNTIPIPSNFYGNSKLQAEEGLQPLQSDNFKIVIIRPPMIYGKGSKGNYPKLAKAAQKLPVFPDIDNHRSMLHIDNLSEFIRLMIENEENGLFFPQNSEYVKISNLVTSIAEVHGRNVRLTKIFNPMISLIGLKIGIINKVFGNLAYDLRISEYKDNYRVNDFRDSIILTEKQEEKLVKG